MDETLPVAERISEVSYKKAKAVLQTAQKGDVIISADTAVVLNGEVLGKPKTKEDAFNMLSKLSGKTHSVITAFTVTNGKTFVNECVETFVTFRKISKVEIEEYISTGEPSDKAGAYGIQGKGGKFVTGISGDYFSVVGLPICRLSVVLKDFLPNI